MSHAAIQCNFTEIESGVQTKRRRVYFQTSHSLRVFCRLEQALLVDSENDGHGSVSVVEGDCAEVDLPVASNVLGGESIFLQARLTKRSAIRFSLFDSELSRYRIRMSAEPNTAAVRYPGSKQHPQVVGHLPRVPVVRFLQKTPLTTLSLPHAMATTRKWHNWKQIQMPDGPLLRNPAPG